MMSCRSLLAVAALAGAACHRLPPAPGEPHTQVQVFNQCRRTLTVGEKSLPYWTSWPCYVVHATVESIPLADSAGSRGTLVIFSLVDAATADNRHAAVNLADSGASIAVFEASPDIDAAVMP
jgi:hypothetical protein